MFRARTFWTAKCGNAADEYEDALAVDLATGRFAVADGASESSYSGHWARMLVEEFTRLPPDAPFNWTAWLPKVQARWTTEIGERSTQAPQAWFVQSTIATGSFATFLGLSLHDGPAKRWQAWAVGDSCVFQIRNGSMYNSFPLGRADEFNTNPVLLGSRSSVDEIVRIRADFISASWEPGDQFWLMTDALAHWFLACNEAESSPVRPLARLVTMHESDPDEFSRWLQQMRDAKEIRNDDVTFVSVQT